MRTIPIVLGASIELGSPTEFVFTAEQVDAISEALSRLDWVREAHLPAIAGEQSLLIVPRRGASPNVEALSRSLGPTFDMLAVSVMEPDDSRLQAVRSLDTRVYLGQEGSPRFRDLFLAHAGAMLDRGLALESWLGENEPSLDVGAGQVVFCTKGWLRTRKHKFSIQVLGEESTRAGTWTWAWADVRVPKVRSRRVDVLRRQGEQNRIPEFASPVVDLDEVGAVTLAVVACGELRGAAFCRMENDAGATYVMLTDPIVELDRIPSGDEVAEVIDMLGHWTLRNPRAAVEAFARARGVSLQARGNQMIATGADGGTVSFRFDERGRVRSVTRTIL
jgi:Family of unknown function (DUF6882)